MSVQHKLAIITGATSGIGAAFARRFASLEYDLLITGRRVEKINALAQKLVNKYQVNVEVVIAELSNKEDLNALLTKIANLNKVDILINNAGFGVRSSFANGDADLYANMINVHVMSSMQLARAVLPKMLPYKSGAIINVSSVHGFIALSGSSVYAATKSFLNKFSLILSKELKNTGVKVQALCPGLTDTDFFPRLDEDLYALTKKRGVAWLVMSSADVVNISLRYLRKNRVICIPGIRNKFLVSLLKGRYT